jgi:hypothetical protein
MTYKPLPYSDLDPYYKISKINWTGHSFLINPKDLFYYRYKYKDVEIVEYIGLASLRSYAEYKVMNTTTLDLLACLEKENLINNNSLLYIKNDKVHFIYEEAIQGETDGYSSI